MPEGKAWSAEEDAVILNNFETKSARQIVAMLRGRTRSAVIGRCYRLRVSTKGNVSSANVTESKRSGRRPKPRPVQLGLFPKRPKPSLPKEIPPPQFLGLTFAELGSGCRWPTGQPPFLFCGCECFLPSRPYCAYHERMSRNVRKSA